MEKSKKYKSGPQYDRAPSIKSYKKSKGGFFSNFISTISFGYCKVKWKRLFRTIWVLYLLILVPLLFDYSNWIEMMDYEAPAIIIITVPASIPFFLFSYILKPFMVDMD